MRGLSVKNRFLSIGIYLSRLCKIFCCISKMIFINGFLPFLSDSLKSIIIFEWLLNSFVPKHKFVALLYRIWMAVACKIYFLPTFYLMLLSSPCKIAEIRKWLWSKINRFCQKFLKFTIYPHIFKHIPKYPQEEHSRSEKLLWEVPL